MLDPTAETLSQLARENEELRNQLLEAQELIDAVRTGAVDALAIQGADGPRIFTLEGADQLYRTLIEEMNEGALLLSQDGTILYCNACLASMLHRELAEVMGSLFNSFIPASFTYYWEELLAKGWAGKCKGELLLQTWTGSLLPFSLSMNVLLTFNETPVLAVIITDTSAQREIEVARAQVAEQSLLLDYKNEQLKREEATRRAIERSAAEVSRMLEGIPQIAWTANPQGEKTYLNRRWFDYTGQENDQHLNLQWEQHLHPADTEAAAAGWLRCRQRGDFFEVEYRLRNKAGDYRWMLGRALPSCNSQGEIIQWIGTHTDIHEHKLALERIDQAQRQLQQNNEQLIRTNVDLDNFIYTASHDLKAPIVNIEGLLHALRSQLPETQAEVQPILAMMQDSVDRFKRTIEHLTNITKLQKEHTPALELVDLGAVIEGVCLDLAPLIQESGAQITVTTHDCQAIPFSEKNLRSVVYNLLSNALKYRAPERAAQVHIRCRQGDDYVVMAVEDNGLGLDLTRHKLFTMFQRFHDHVEGSGIGLYMVKRIVENAGGKIEVQSQVGTGTIILIHFLR